MKIKLAENLPHRLATLLKNLGHEVHTLYEERRRSPGRGGLGGNAEGIKIPDYAGLDFSDSRKFAPGSHHGILLIRLRSPNRRALIERIAEMFRKENVGEWVGCFVVATERKIRVLRCERREHS